MVSVVLWKRGGASAEEVHDRGIAREEWRGMLEGLDPAFVCLFSVRATPSLAE